MLAGIAGDDTGLAVGNLAERAAPLASDTDGVGALLGKVAAIEDQHAALSITEGLGDQLLVFLKHTLVIPATSRDELLHGLDSTAFKSKRHRLDRLALKLKQLSMQIGEGPFALFRALEEGSKVGMVGDKFISKSLDIAWSKVVLR